MRQDDGLTAHAHRLLDILQVRGDWMSSVNLARGLDRKYLPAYSVQLLQSMAKQGLIEVRISTAKNGFDSYEYRAKPEAANGV